MNADRNAWLDSLRAFAIIAVVTCHSAAGFCDATNHPRTGIYAALGLGGHGVDLFFVLSGWLLGGVLFREQQRTQSIQLRRFWMRRWLRTLPAYYAVLALTLGQRFFQGRNELSDLWYFVFAQTYALSELPFLGISWSLCVEEHFYLLIAPLLLLGGRRNILVSVILLVLILSPACIRWSGLQTNVNQTHLRIDQCTMGVLLAHLSIAYPRVFERLKALLPVLLPATVVILLGMFLARYANIPFDLPLLAYAGLSGILVVLSQANDFWRSSATHPILRYIAIRSYSLYLVHVEAIAAMKYFNWNHFIFYAIATWALSIAIAELLYRLVELPGMQWRDRSKRLVGS